MHMTCFSLGGVSVLLQEAPRPGYPQSVAWEVAGQALEVTVPVTLGMRLRWELVLRLLTPSPPRLQAWTGGNVSSI